ncbi:2-oxoglutarate and iron-dependent oxygenase JMJD4 homolog [Anopheles bellator]|uniref:2-oxoglutarate and iron-dependent oxygenase JMJD4 homolog n=1 Tax=Anopheles bellator TaxID=139047 RepID=UPI0026498AB8|nr:2-oxoglutarate and iron-dependent oxygenase JMJD4 homolog [Anopheles bellator]
MAQIEIEPFQANDPVSSSYSEAGIERIAAKDITYSEFFTRFMRPNRPVILTSIAQNWECFNHWIDRSVDPSQLDVQYLKSKLPNLSVPVADCETQRYNAHEKLEVKLYDFLDSWQSPSENSKRGRYYLKDWHLRSMVPEYGFYETPHFFASDWLNEYLLERGLDDYRFVYIGAKGTWTAFHADVFGSYSWSVNIGGRKLWYFLPPSEEQKLADCWRNLPFRVTERSLQDAGVKFYAVQQQPGEAVFVPTGWYHQVLNVEDAISVNHNWFNGCNVATLWRNLRSALCDVRREIDDCRDMENFDEHCQLMLKASFGMNYADFFAIIYHIGDKRLKWLKDDGVEMKQYHYTMGRHHAVFDLVSIANLLSEVVELNHLASYREMQNTVASYLERIKQAIASV